MSTAAASLPQKRRVSFREGSDIEEVVELDDVEGGGHAPPATTRVWSWVDDLMEGFAEVYTVTIGGVHTCTSSTRSAVYPVK